MKIGARILIFGLVSLLGPIGPKLVCTPKTPGKKFILIF